MATIYTFGNRIFMLCRLLCVSDEIVLERSVFVSGIDSFARFSLILTLCTKVQW